VRAAALGGQARGDLGDAVVADRDDDDVRLRQRGRDLSGRADDARGRAGRVGQRVLPPVQPGHRDRRPHQADGQRGADDAGTEDEDGGRRLGHRYPEDWEDWEDGIDDW